jgi:hypothetical protein
MAEAGGMLCRPPRFAFRHPPWRISLACGISRGFGFGFKNIQNSCN